MFSSIRSGGIKVVTDGLGLYYDAAYKQSYPGTGATWTDLANGTTCAIGSIYYAWYSGNGGYFSDFANFNTTFQINSSYSVTNLSGITMQAVVRFDRNQYEQATILASSNNGGNAFSLTPTGIISDGGSRRAETTLTTGTYYFISTTRNVSNLSLSVRINSGARTTNTYASLPNVSFTNGWMVSSTRTGGVVLLDPRVAVVLFYTRALTPDEEVANYHALKLRYGI